MTTLYAGSAGTSESGLGDQIQDLWGRSWLSLLVTSSSFPERLKVIISRCDRALCGNGSDKSSLRLCPPLPKHSQPGWTLHDQLRTAGLGAQGLPTSSLSHSMVAGSVTASLARGQAHVSFTSAQRGVWPETDAQWRSVGILCSVHCPTLGSTTGSHVQLRKQLPVHVAGCRMLNPWPLCNLS